MTDEATGDPIEGISVSAFNTAGNQYGILNRTTNANGEYTLYMRTGSYRVHVNTDGTPYKDEYYDNVEDQGSATLIDITEGNDISGGDTVSDIDFALALHTGGSISGRVLDPDGNPVPFAGVNANAIVWCNGCNGSVQANAQGYYTIDKLPATDYRVRASVGGYPDQHYYKQVGENNATPVTVTLGQDTPNIDFKLLRGGKITGQVRYPNSDPVEGMYMSASAINGGGWGNAYTDSNGIYEIDTLPPGHYSVYANPVDGQNAADKIYMLQYYNNQENEEDADPVTVVDEQTTSGIDFDLVVGGTISGTLRDINNNTIANRRIDAWPADGNYYAYTDGDGDYTIQGLPYGDYIAAPSLNWQTEQDYLRVYWNQKARYNADIITLSAGSPDVTGINFKMVIGGKITGRVTAGAIGLEDVDIAVLSSDGRWIEEESTDSSGNYEVTGLPGGSFKVLADPYDSDYAFAYYNNTSDWGSAGNVNVTLGNTISGINFSLTTGGKIAGRVVREGDGQPIANVQVDADDANYGERDDVGYANTDSDGNYEIQGLPTGDYKVKVRSYDDNDFVGEYYNDQADWSSADAVNVTAGSTTTGIDVSVALTAPTQAPRIISPVYQTAASLPVFAWTAVSSGTSYDLLVNDLTDATTGVIDESGMTGTTFTPSSSLAQNHEYEVQVRAVNGAGQGPWSPVTLFTQLQPLVYDLTVTIDPSGSGTVTLDPAGGSYDAGTEVALTAAANAGWMFQSWTGDVINPASPSTTITVDENPEEVTVTFLADTDSDGIANSADNCPSTPNPGQENADGDADGDACDVCPNDPDNDADGDGACGDVDACPNDPAKQTDVDSDGDGTADCADPDDDNDGMPDTFEAIYGWLDPLDPSDALEDQDGDGHMNVKEYLAGSDLDDWLSTPQILIADWYVDGDVASSGNGATWATAFKTIQEAIDAAEKRHEIWVKKGTYALSSRIDVNKGVLLFGGFSGTETERDQRDWRNNVTTVDGQDQVYHCFYVRMPAFHNANATIDGFTIMRGNADGDDSDPDYNGSGGGIYNLGSATTIANCTFMNNNATAFASGGGAIYVHGVDPPTITNCAFYWNQTIGGGCHGGAIHIWSSNPTITNCTFYSNHAGGLGGAVLINGGAWDGEATLINCTFSRNTSIGNITEGGAGAIYNANSAEPTITNCILWDNSAFFGHDEIYNDSISDANVSYCDVQGGTGEGWFDSGTDNIDTDPKFVDADNGDLHIMPDSPCVDTGDNSAVPPGVTSDIDGNLRIINDVVDMGADEYNRTWYVDAGTGASGNGMFWSETFKTIQEAVDAAQNGDEIWVKQGDYLLSSAINVGKAVLIFGGFAGTEIGRTQRDWIANKTTVDGQGTVAHCFDVSENATIDGVTITGGNANGSAPDDKGGGLYIGVSGATVTNCEIKDNDASATGGGVYNLGSGLIANSLLFGNHAVDGGGVATENSSLAIVNCTLSENASTNGGGIWTNDSSTTTITNCIIWGNTATNGVGIHVAGAAAPDVSYSDVEGGTGQSWFVGTDLDVDPEFVDSSNDDFHLQGDSPCLDVGNDASVPADITEDFDGDERILDGDEDGTDTVDMGADEYKHVPAIWYVDGSIGASGDGTSWAEAFKTMEEAVENPLLRNFDEIWVKAGTYTPTAPNGWGSNGAGLTITKAIKIYGGFPAGASEPDWSDRDWKANETVVDAQADLQTITGGRNRCFNIQSTASTFPESKVGYPIIDGFTITGGKQWDGGGITMTRRSPTISNCIITENEAKEGIGVGNGGGIYAFGDLCAPTIVNCLISGNTASFGGAIWFGRTAGWTDNHPLVINCTITGNTTNGMDPIYDAGTIHIIRSYETSIGAKILNSILWDNALPSGGAEIFSWLDPSWADPIGKSIISYNDIEGASGESWFNNGTNGTDNVDTGPLFVDPDGADDDASTWADNDYHPGEIVCINAGDNSAVPSDISDLDGDDNASEPLPFDLAHEPRFSGTVDMGAYEVGDSDGDGVMNIDDNCPFTPNPLQEDDDGDNIGNVCDACPNDANNDADGDGICGDVDTCPNDPDNDADSDGICGDVDICPNDPDNDADGDGVCGDVDGCPGDPGKTAPGQCGCGVADTDTDSDGTANCNDSDDDGDDLPDVWENAYGLDPLDATGDDGKDGDFDGDGYSNYDEFLAGTEPDDGASVPLEIKEVIPHDGAGVAPDDTRIPNNTSFAVCILAPAGIDVTEDMSIVFTVDDDIDDGTNTPYERNLGDPTVAVTKLDPNEPDTVVTALWAVYHRSQEGAPDNVYDWENKVEIWVDSTDTADVDMIQESYTFEIETETEHDDAAATSPVTDPVGAGDPDLVDPDYTNAEGIEVTSGDLEGCKIIYESSEPVRPELGPSDEIPPFDNSGIDAVGVPMNLQPPTVFTNPVTIMIPCPGEPDVSILSVYMYNGTDWVEACDAAGNVLPGGVDWMVFGSREDDNTRTPPIIAIKVYHFTGVQAGAAIKGEDIDTKTTPSATTDLGGSGGGGGCFVLTAAHGSSMGLVYALVLGVITVSYVVLVRRKRPA